jgi:hypothetical protein
MNIKRNDFLNVPFFKKKCIAITDSYSHYETIFAREEPRFNINKISGWTQPLSIFFLLQSQRLSQNISLYSTNNNTTALSLSM